jgi:UDP-4-amino-4,6-dideoxy-N-acetyl-beta-L-altrosamine N-acetyltransferase
MWRYMLGIDNDKEIMFGKFIVRPVRESDLPAMLERRNEAAMRRVMFTEHVITWEEHKVWFASIDKLAPKLHFIVEKEGLAIGYLGYGRVDFASGVCYGGAYSLPSGKEAPLSGLCLTEISLEYAFAVLKMRKVCGEVLAKANAKLLKLHESYFGYRREGLLKEQVKKNGEYEDVALLALFRADWLARRGQYLINN